MTDLLRCSDDELREWVERKNEQEAAILKELRELAKLLEKAAIKGKEEER